MSDTPAPPPCHVIELRQYTLRPGRRDALIALFEREFIAPQEAAGMTLFGQFRDLDAPDRFVWLRGFADMPARAEALGAFYGGPVWQAHRDAANATMLDSDNVLLLRPARADSGFAVGQRSPLAPASPPPLVVATLCSCAMPIDDRWIGWFESTVAPLLVEAGADLLATLVTEPSPNTFPRLPVREGEHVLAWFTAFATTEAYLRHRDALARNPAWQAAVDALDIRRARIETLRLSPTPQSRMPRLPRLPRLPRREA